MHAASAGAGPRSASIERIVIDDAGVGRAHHRQEGPARQPRRPRPLHPVHGGGAADLRAADRRGLRGRGRARSAHRRAARARCRCARTRPSPRTTSTPTSATSATPCRCSSRDGSADASACTVDYPIGHRRRRAEGIPVLVKKFESSVDALLRRQAGGAHQGAVRPGGRARCAAGERAHGGAGHQRAARLNWLRAAAHRTRTCRETHRQGLESRQCAGVSGPES